MNQLYPPPGKVSANLVKHRQFFFNCKKLFLILAFLVSAVASKAQFTSAENMSFPIPVISNNFFAPPGCTNPSLDDITKAGRTGIINLLDSGAVGDGQTDCTAAFRKILGKPKQGSAATFLYIPNGIYLVRDTIGFSPEYFENFNGRKGTGASNIQMWGQSRTGVIIRLAPGSPRFQDPTRLWAFFDTGRESADRFGNSISNVTFEIGANNPSAIGVRQYLNNYGGLYNVTIRALDGSPKIGLDKSYSRANGPSLTKDVRIEGFETGIRTDFVVESDVYEHLTLRNQTKRGWFNKKGTLVIRDLKVENCQGPALVNEAGFINILDSEVSGTSGGPAIRNGTIGQLLALRVTNKGGYTQFVADPQKPQGSFVPKYLSDEGVLPNGQRSDAIEPLNLQVKETPIIPWETDMSRWVNVKDFGATAGGQCGGTYANETFNPCRPCDDDASTIQAAINSTLPGQPNHGKTHLYLPANYRIYTTIKVQGTIQRIFMPSTTSVGQPGNGRSLTDFTKRVEPSWDVLAGTGAVEFYGMITGFQSPDPGIVPMPVVRSSSGRTIIFKNCGFLPYGGPTIDISNGEVFIESSSIGNMRFNNVNVWARQNNPEAPNIKVEINGGSYWGLGLKTEQTQPAIVARNRAKVEIYGAFIYNTHNSSSGIMFDLNNSQMSVSMLEYFGAFGKGFGTLVRDVNTGQPTNTLLPGTESNPTYKAPWSQNNDSSLVYNTAPSNIPYIANRFGNAFLLYRNTSSSLPSENWVMVDDQVSSPGNHTLTYNPIGSSTGWQSWSVGGAYLSTSKATNNSNAEAILTFTGDKVGLYAAKANNRGQADIILDGAFVTTIDLYAATEVQNQQVFLSANLTAGTHTLIVRRKGTQNGSSSGALVVIDAFEYRATGGGTTNPTPVSSITVTPGNQTVTAGTNNLQYTATISPTNATNKTVTWSSTNTAVATVNSTTGVVNAVAAGQTTIRATATDGSGVQGSATLTVNPASGGSGYTQLLGDNGWYWQNMTGSNQDGTKNASDIIKNNILTDQVNVPDADANGWQAAGLTWNTARSGISKVELYHGFMDPNVWGENGTFTANVKVQYWNGTTWTDAPGWALTSPSTYPYNDRNAASNQTFTFTGSALPSTTGIRVVGQVHTSDVSWGIYVREIKAYTTSGGTTPPPPAGTGVGYHWKNLASRGTDGILGTTKIQSNAVNDGSMTSYNSIGDNQEIGHRQAVGIIWSTPVSGISSVKFHHGEVTWEGGFFTPGETIKVQYQLSANGSWIDAGWGGSPLYPYSAAASNGTYTFSGGAFGAIYGIRVIGQVKTNDDSWAIYYKELEVFAGGTKISSTNDKSTSQLQLNQNTVSEKITVFPNPVTDGWINLGLNAADKNSKVDVLISDLSGRVVYKSSFTSNGISERLNLSNVQPGAYVIRITGANTKFSSKVIIE
jgi:uncharacterized protein YjdB